MSAASAPGAGSTWTTVSTWQGHTLPLAGGGRWAYTMRLQQLRLKPQGPALGWRLAIEWPADWPEALVQQVKRHAFRVCLFPRFQQPLLLTLTPGSTEVPVRGVAAEQLRSWPQALEGTPLSVMPMP